MITDLPQPTPEAQASSQALQALIKTEIQKSGGWIPFSRFMELALYAPRYGYYTGGSHKIGNSGDFITAPTLTPLFGQTIARQLGPLLKQTSGNIYEFGAGTGELAATILKELSEEINHYYIIEVSQELAERQRQHLLENIPEALPKVRHLSTLPDFFNGIVIGNEILDAIPCELICHQNGSFLQVGVSETAERLTQATREISDGSLFSLATKYIPPLEGYTSELHPAQYAFIQTIGRKLAQGAMIFIDYGFDAQQYYHPQRHMGTFIGHYRHHSIHDPFFNIGLTDLTSHVNFTDIAQSGTDIGLDLIGYTSQANFLLNLGIADLLTQTGRPDSAEYIRSASAVQKLINQHEMGELFKVIAFGKNIDVDWQGFAYGDICYKL